MPPRTAISPRLGDQVGPGVADLDQPDEQIVEFAPLADVQADRLEIPKPRHDRLQQASDRRHHHGERPIRLAGVSRMSEPPQHGDPLANRVGSRR